MNNKKIKNLGLFMLIPYIDVDLDICEGAAAIAQFPSATNGQL